MSDLVKRYRDLQISIGGCHDGYCVIKKPQGMHTNGGCNCLEDMKLHERSRVGGLLKYGQEMADRIEEMETKLAKAVEFIEDLTGCEWPYCEDAKRVLAELKGQDYE